MTTGYTSIGGSSIPGLFLEKSWAGSDYPSGSRSRIDPKPPLRDAYGRPLLSRKREDVAAAVIRRRASEIRRGRASAPRIMEDHAYSCNWRKGYNPIISFQYGSAPFESFLGAPAAPVGQWDSNDDLTLISKLRSRILGSDFNIGVFLAESNQALGMIVQSATKLAKAYSQARRGDLFGAERTLYRGFTDPSHFGKSAASSWLELQYGWKPLLNDIDDAARFLAHQQYAHRTKVFRVTHRKDIGPPVSSSPANYTMVGDGYMLKTIIARVTKVDVPQLSGLTDIRSIVWEKTPWSFVVDWVVPIGSYLEALNTISSLEASYVVTTVSRSRGTAGSSGPDSPWTGLEGYRCEIGSMNRSIGLDIQVPLPSVKRPEKIATVGHAINALALLVQKIR